MPRKIFASFASIAALAALMPALAETDDREIIVIGQSLDDTARALAECKARGCPPDEEMRAALAHAENQFVDGGYRDAKSTLLKSLGRNRKHAKQYPIELSDTLRATARISEHLGEADRYRIAVLDMRDAMKKGLEADDPRLGVANIEVGDSRAKLGYFDEALGIYEREEKRALAAGQGRVAAFARIRRLTLDFNMAREGHSAPEIRKARAALQQFADNPIDGGESMSLVAAVALARYDRSQGNSASTDAIVKKLAALGSSKPLLLAAEPIKVPKWGNGDQALIRGQRDHNHFDMPGAKNVLTMLPGNFENRWLDVGFWVNPNGNVSDIEILRARGDLYWAGWVTDSIKSRIYAPLKQEDGNPSAGFYMVERYTYTARYMEETTGTRIATRTQQPRIERIDLTPDTQ